MGVQCTNCQVEKPIFGEKEKPKNGSDYENWKLKLDQKSIFGEKTVPDFSTV